MFKNYLKIAVRNLVKNKVYSLINILGLTIGMTGCLLILHYVNYEKSYDRFHKNSERIYRLRYERTSSEEKTVRFASCCPPAAPFIRTRYPEVEKIARIFRYRAVVSHNDIKFTEERMYFAEPDFLDILKFKFIEGDRLNGIREPNKAFFSKSTAEKYFGDKDPIGKIFSIDKKTDYLIVGIFEDIPQNSHLKFDILLSYENLISLYGQEYQNSWGHTGSYTYLRLAPHADPVVLENKFVDLVKSECPWLKEYKMSIDLKMQPLNDIHLASHFMQEYEINGNRNSVNFLFIIALFIIIIAWVNYINLSTARSLTLTKEVCLRKIVGASRQQLMFQFFFQTILINFIAILCAMGFIELLRPFISQITGIPLDFSIWSQNWFWITVSIMFFAGVFLSGLYPVIIMSSFEPAALSQSKFAGSGKRINLRKFLVVFQFIMSLILITGTFTVYQQISFMRNQDLGFDIEQTIVIKAPRVREKSYGEKFKSFKETLLSNTNIHKICHVTEVPGRQILWDAGAIRKAGEDISKGKNYQIVGIDYDFVDVFNLKFAYGRNFSKKFSTDKDALILNETAVQWMGFEESKDAIGQKVDYWGNIYTIIGVLKDYHQQSLKQAFEPHIFRLMPHGRDIRGVIALKISLQNIQETLSLINHHYDGFFPGNPFDYFFLDDYFNQQYKSDELFGKVFSIFSSLAIFLTCLGVFGLSSFMTIQRTKEIGIRKVLGASVSGIVVLLTKEFIKWVLIANIIAWPIAYYAISKWLENFAYRINIGIWTFLLAGVIAVLIALLTVSYQAVKTATANPVEALRYE